MSSAFDYYSETKTGFGFNLKPVLLNRMRPKTEIWQMWLEFRPIRQTNTTCDRNFGTRKEKQKREI